MSIHRAVRGAALTALLLFFACGEDGDHYAPLGNDETPPATVVAGLVRDGEKDAVKDALVVIEPASDGVAASTEWLAKNPDAASETTPGRRVTTTNGRGYFAFDQVDAGDYFLQVIADDHLGAMHSINVPDRMAFVDTVYADVNLTPTGTFSGVTTLEGASNHVGIVVFAEGTSYVAVTGSSGSYELTDVPVGSYTVHAMRPGYVDDTETGTITTAGESVALASMLLKIDSNIPPVANIVSASPHVDGFPVNFVATGSDADGSVTLYEWDWEDDGTFDYSSAITPNTSHTYPIGNHRAKLRVTDDQGGIGLDVYQITIYSAVYVATSGSDLNNGTTASPVATLTRAYQIAFPGQRDVILIEEGIYTGAPVFESDIDVYGGRTLPSWGEGVGHSQFNYAATRATADNITTATLIRRVSLNMTAPAAGTNAIALYSLGSSPNLRFEECEFLVANGLGGASGTLGNPGAGGGNGIPGTTGSCDLGHGNGGGGGSSPVGCTGGAGGRGGLEGANPGLAGSPGGCSGGAGGSAGPGGDPGGDGGNGTSGLAGPVGSPGTPASNAGSVVANEWVPNTSGGGTVGVNGRGGGGGGGGGGQGCTFCDDGGGNGAGGGGGGGQAGGGGSGGQGGRAAFCVMLVNSSPQFSGCFFGRGFGGTGGAGANGGAGGAGGFGAAGAVNCPAEIGTGGNGGNGGFGGAGGGGAGGPGGPSYGIYKVGASAPATTMNTYSGGGPGTGGTGAAGAPSGPNGLFGSTN